MKPKLRQEHIESIEHNLARGKVVEVKIEKGDISIIKIYREKENISVPKGKGDPKGS